jgi:hypothetical protein
MQSWCFLVVSLASGEGLKRVNDLRQLPEKRMACVLQVAKQVDYSPKQHILRALSVLSMEDAAPNHAQGPLRQKSVNTSYSTKEYMQN